MQATCDTHLFGSRGGYRTVAGSSGVSPRERAELEIFGFGQLSDRRGQQMLLERASAFGRRLSSGRFAVTRILPGPDDDGGRPTLELRTVLLDRASYGAIAASGISLLIDTGAVWSAAAFAEGRSMSLAVGPRRAIETREIHRRLADAWLSTRTSPQQMVRADEADGARILELAALLDPSDLDEFRWGVGVLSTAVPVDLFTLAPIGSGSGRRQVRDLPKSGPWVHANVANLPERGPWPPLRGVVSRQSTGPVGLAERTPEEWTYDGPLPIARRRGPDRRVVLAGAAILVLGLGAIIAMLLFSGSDAPSRSQEFARLPESPETDRGRAGDRKDSDSDGTAAVGESQGREEKTPVPGKGMGFPTNPPPGGTVGGSGSTSPGQGAPAGGGEQSANPPPPKAPTGDSSSKPAPEAPTGATPPGRPPGESTASKPAETDSTSGVTPAGGGNPPLPGDATGSNGGSAFQTGSSDGGEQIGDECDCDDEKWRLKIPAPTDWSPNSERPIDQLAANVDIAVSMVEKTPDHAYTLLNEAWSIAKVSMENTPVLQWVTDTEIDDVINSVKEKSSDRQAQIQQLQTRMRDIARVSVTVETWIDSIKIGNAPEVFEATDQPDEVAEFRRDMRAYLCRLRAFFSQLDAQSDAVAKVLWSTENDWRTRWADFIKSRLTWPQPTPNEFHWVKNEVESYLDRFKRKTNPRKGVADGIKKWVLHVSQRCDPDTKDCLTGIVDAYFD